MWSVLNCLDILSEDKDAATSSTADSLLKNIFCFNFVLGIMVPNSVLISIVYLHLLSTAVPAAAAHLPRAQPEVGAGRGGDQPVRGGDTLGCRVSATMVAVWMLCEKYRFDLANLASVPTSLVLIIRSERIRMAGLIRRRCTNKLAEDFRIYVELNRLDIKLNYLDKNFLFCFVLFK